MGLLRFLTTSHVLTREEIMAKLTNVRERVHQAFRDSLIRTSGWYASSVQDRTDLFTQAGRDDGVTNLKNGSTLPSDQSLVVLALRVFTWFRAPHSRNLAGDVVVENGDYTFEGNPTGEAVLAASGNAIGDDQDVYRLNWQAEEQLLWSVGAGEKFSLSSMPTSYFPWGGGLSGDMGFAGVIWGPNPEEPVSRPYKYSPMIHWQNGTPDHSGILRLARALLIPPRQNIRCQANIVALPDGGNGQAFQTSQGSRNMLSLRDNLNALDGIEKCVSMCLDGLFSRDVQ